MPHSNKSDDPSQIDRRQLLQGAVGAGLAAGLGAIPGTLAAAAEKEGIAKSVARGLNSNTPA